MNKQYLQIRILETGKYKEQIAKLKNKAKLKNLTYVDTLMYLVTLGLALEAHEHLKLIDGEIQHVTKVK